jgi:hypothetical protein
LQVFTGSTVQYSGSASDPNGYPLSWQWIYTVNGGPEIILQSGTGAVPTVSYNYSSSTAGSTYIWKLRVSNGSLTSESDLTVGVEPQPVPTTALTFPAAAATVSGPFVLANGYLTSTLDVSSQGQAGVTNGGQAVFNFNISTPGSYAISALVNAPNVASKSFWINIDAQPTDPTMIWDIYPYTTSFVSRLVSWRGAGTFNADQFSPKIFNLSAGAHQLIVVGREPGAQLQSVSIVPLPTAPPNFRIVSIH